MLYFCLFFLSIFFILQEGKPGTREVKELLRFTQLLSEGSAVGKAGSSLSLAPFLLSLCSLVIHWFPAQLDKVRLFIPEERGKKLLDEFPLVPLRT